MSALDIIEAMRNGARLFVDQDVMTGQRVFMIADAKGASSTLENQTEPRTLASSGAIVCTDACACGRTEYIIAEA